MTRVRPTKFAHVVYRTRRYEEMLDWYETVFDAKVQFKNPTLAFLTYDDEHHRFALANLAALKPGGNQSEFQVECFGSSDEANEFMSGPGFAANPIGVEYDPEECLSRRKAGEPVFSFVVRRVHEPISPIRGAMSR